MSGGIFHLKEVLKKGKWFSSHGYCILPCVCPSVSDTFQAILLDQHYFSSLPLSEERVAGRPHTPQTGIEKLCIISCTPFNIH